jgi:hypothetical protein
MCVNDQHESSRSPDAQSDSEEHIDDELPEHFKLPTNSQALQAAKGRTVQRKINQIFGMKVELKHFSKHTSEEMEQVAANNEELVAATKKCSTCKASLSLECFSQGARTCTTCRTKRSSKRAAKKTERTMVSKEGK